MGVLVMAAGLEVVRATAGADIACVTQEGVRLEGMLESEDSAMDSTQIAIDADEAIPVSIACTCPQPASGGHVTHDLCPKPKLKRAPRTMAFDESHQAALGATMAGDHFTASTFAGAWSRIDQQYPTAELGFPFVDCEIAGSRAEQAPFDLRRRALKRHGAVLTDMLYGHRWESPSVSGPRRLNHARGPNGGWSIRG